MNFMNSLSTMASPILSASMPRTVLRNYNQQPSLPQTPDNHSQSSPALKWMSPSTVVDLNNST